MRSSVRIPLVHYISLYRVQLIVLSSEEAVTILVFELNVALTPHESSNLDQCGGTYFAYRLMQKAQNTVRNKNNKDSIIYGILI
jgi:hypothetical protein